MSHSDGGPPIWLKHFRERRRPDCPRPTRTVGRQSLFSFLSLLGGQLIFVPSSESGRLLRAQLTTFYACPLRARAFSPSLSSCCCSWWFSFPSSRPSDALVSGDPEKSASEHELACDGTTSEQRNVRQCPTPAMQAVR